MPHGLVSTGVSFPDGTTQTTAALAPLTSGIQQTVTAASTTTIDLNLGSFVRLSHGTNITTLNFTNVPANRAVLVKLLRQKDDSHIERTIAWQSNWRVNATRTGQFRSSALGVRRTNYYTSGQAPDNRFVPSSNINVIIGSASSIAEIQEMTGRTSIVATDEGVSNFGLLLTQSPLAAEMFEFLTIDGGTTWRVLGREWVTSAARYDQDIFVFGWPPGEMLGYPQASSYGSTVSTAISASVIDWVPGSGQIARGHGRPLPYINPWDIRNYAFGGGTVDPNQNGGVENGYRRYEEWRALQLYGTRAVEIHPGQNHAVWLGNTGHLFCAGSNGHAGLGRNYTMDGILERQPYLTKPLLSPVTQIANGRHGNAVIVNGNQLFTWGLDNYGQRGQNMTQWGVSSPVQISSSSSTWSYCDEAYETVYMLKANGTLWMMGRGTEGQSGDNTGQNRSSPTQIGTATNWVRVKGGHLNVVAINSSGEIYAWGQNNYGQCGNLSTTNVSTPTLVLGTQGYATGVDKFDVGTQYAMAIKNDGTLWGWGRGDLGQQGHYPGGVGMFNRSSPMQVGSDNNWNRVYCSGHATLALKNDGTLWGWGHNDQWQLCLLDTNYGGVVGMPYREETTHRKSSPIQLNSSTKWQRLFVQGDENGAYGGRTWYGFANTAAIPSGQTTVL